MTCNMIWSEFNDIRNKLRFSYYDSVKGKSNRFTDAQNLILIEYSILYLAKTKAISIVHEEKENDPDLFLLTFSVHDNIVATSVLIHFPETRRGEKCKEYLNSTRNIHDLSFQLVKYIDYVVHHYISISDYVDVSQRIWDSYCGEKEFEGYAQPKEISSLVSKLINRDNGFSLYNPFGGAASYALSMSNRFGIYYGQDINEFISEVSKFRLEICDILNASFNQEDSFENWPKQKYDVIVSTPPFHLSLRDVDDVINPDHYSEVWGWILSKAENSLNTNGQMICITSPRYLNAPNYHHIRKKIIEKNLLDSVILLPSKIWTNTSMITAVICLKNGRSDDQKISFFDARDYFQTENRFDKKLDVERVVEKLNSLDNEDIKRVTRKQVEETGYLFSPIRYTVEMSVPEGHKLIELREIATVSYLNTNLRVSQGKLVDGTTSIFSYIVESKDLQITSFGHDVHVSIIDRPTLLLDLNFPRIVYVLATNVDPVYVHYNRWVKCELNEDLIDRDYFVYSYCNMDTNVVRAQMEGTLLKRFTISSLSLFKLPILPDVLSQKKMMQEVKRAELMNKAKELGLLSLIQEKDAEIRRIKDDYINEVRNRKHDMKTPMAQLRSTMTLMSSLSKNLPEDFSAKLNLYISRQKIALDTLSEIVQHIADEDVFAEPEEVDIEGYLSSLTTKNEKYTIEFHRDEAALAEAGIDKPIIKIGKVDFMRLVQNIVGNAIKHGFSGDYSEYAIHITLSVEENFYTIDFSNNGRPFPEGMDKSRYGMKGGKSIDSDGSGRGGYIVKSICQHYGGDFDISSNKFAGMYFTNVIVKLPIYYTE